MVGAGFAVDAGEAHVNIFFGFAACASEKALDSASNCSLCICAKEDAVLVGEEAKGDDSNFALA